MLHICRYLHGYLMYNLHTDHDTPFTLYPLPGYWPSSVLVFFQQGPLSVAWMREFRASRKNLHVKIPSFPEYQHILNNRTFRRFGLKSSTKKRFTCSQKWKPRPGTLTKLPPPLPSVCGWQSGGEMTHYKVSQGFRIKLKKFLLKFFWSILLAVIAINILQFSSH